LKPEDFESKFVTWHLRDTSRLEEVEMLGDRRLKHLSERCWDGMLQLLSHLSDKAPALRSLDLVPPRPTIFQYDEEDFHERCFNFLPLVGALSRLESLALREWVYSWQDTYLISHLTSLRNLKVPHSSREESQIRQLCPSDLLLTQWF